VTVVEFLSHLCDLDVKLWVDGDRLRCSAPDGRLTPALRTELAKCEAEIIAFLRGGESAARSISPPVLPTSQEGDLPLSFAQQRLWFLEQWEHSSSVYNLSTAVRLVGRLDVTALEQGLGEIIRRHEALRTTFATVGGHPVQVIAPILTVPLPVLDLCEFPEPEQEAQVRCLATEESQRSFDLSRGPLIRALLLQLNEKEHVLLLTTHCIISDSQSRVVLIRELMRLYHAIGESASLPTLPVQYTDFAVWQQQWLRGKAAQAHIAYWKRRLGSDLSVLELPTDRPRPAIQTFRGTSRSFRLSKALSGKLKAFSDREAITPCATLLTAFNVLLYRYTGQDDIAVGSRIANRNRREIQDLIGLFNNILVIRTDLSGNPCLRDLLNRVWKTTLEACAHQDLPFEVLLEELQPKRDLSHTPLFQAMFNFEDAPIELPGGPDLELELLKVESGTTEFDLTLSMLDTGQGFSGVLEYSTDLFDSDTIDRMLGHFETLLESIVAHSEEHISDLALLTASEQQQLLFEWNDTGGEYPQDRCIHEVFEAQVARTPDVVAVVSGDRCLTYRELDNRASQLAHYLVKLGVGPEVLVGFCVDRSLEMIVGLLGVLKAGGGYVPLDPAYPKERLDFMLKDTQSPVLLTQQRLLERFPVHKAQVVCLDADWEAIAQVKWESPAWRAMSRNLAYVIYTSGSTGRPKGVAIEHHSVVALIHWAKEAFEADLFAGVLASTSICFDLAAFEFFVPLSSGGTVILAETVLDLADLPAVEAVRLINTVPSAMKELLRLEDVPPSVHAVNLAGEFLPTQLVSQIYEQETVCRVHDLYGPSEDTTYSTYALRNAREPATIGRPIANTQVYLLDAHLQPVPAGVKGELHVSGAGLARGYLDRPGLTAGAFIPHPFSDEPGARLYKTGDLARYRPDGNIEFLGRVDHQVKVRGFRIELAEIETVLEQHPDVREAVVLAREIEPSDKRLVAYLVLEERGPTTGELYRFLQRKVPDYMVPAMFIVLDTLPLTPNGKVDRQALPAPDQTRPEVESTFIAPRTPIEELLASIWTRVLGIEQVGVHDNFFELGGHSLLAYQVTSRVNDAFRVNLSLRTMFEAPTVAGLVGHIQTAMRVQQGTQSPPITQISRKDSLPLSFAQQQMWLIDQLEPGNIAYNVPFTLRISGPLAIIALRKSLNEIVRRHAALRTTFATLDGQPVQNIAPSLDLSLPLADLGQLPETRRENQARRLAREEAQRPFELAQGPLLRATLLRLEETEHLLLLTMHHIVTDGWSLSVLSQELATLYQASTTDGISPLPDLPIQYADFAAWQRGWLQGKVLETQLSFWKQKLDGAPAMLELPTDRPRPPVRTFQGARQSLVLPRPLSEALDVLSRREGVSLFMTLLAAFKILLYRYTEQSDIVVGSPIANRGNSAIEKLIGYFVNVLVLRTNLGGNPTFRTLLERVRETAISAYAYHDLPFEVLVEKLRPERDLSHNPLFQVMFVLQNTPPEARELPGLTLSPLEIDTGTTQFDLSLSMTETENGLVGSIEYSTDLFDGETITRMLKHFQTLLGNIVADPDRRLSDLSLLTETERRQVLVEWNDASIEYCRDQCIHELFEAQVTQSPDAVAVIFEDDCLTYRELNRRANQLAHHLQELDVGPDVLVGVCMERSLETVLSLLGVLKAGGVYVPLDPMYPQERLSFMLTDTQLPVLLTKSQLIAPISSLSLLPRIVYLDQDWESIAGQSEANLPVRTVPENLAYTIYTSGSTGQPKGVLISHEAIVSHCCYIRQHYQLTPADRVLQFSSLNFDASLEQILPTLTVGAGLVLRDAEIWSPTDFCTKALELGFTIVDLPPAYWHWLVQEWVDAPDQAQKNHIRLVIIGGDVMPFESLSLWWQTPMKDARLLNAYGPTETTITAITFEVSLDFERSLGRVPIGRPLANRSVYILDEHGNPIPIGAVGELHIGGVGLARGYLNQPDLTAEVFVPNSFPSSSLQTGSLSSIGGEERGGTRLYKTGDLARYLPDGNVEFLGRIDSQVKVRGFRIELGEIEAALKQHPEVQEAIVLARKDVPGDPSSLSHPEWNEGSGTDKRLVAYLITEGREPTAGELRGFLREKLPDYMVPAAFMVLEALPLTHSGKVDRRALPAPDQTRSEVESTFVAPRTPIEELLAGIWARVLGIEQVGVHDNFFELGGHSLLANRVTSRISDTFQLTLSMRVVFEAPTVADLAKCVEAALGNQQEPRMPPIRRVSRKDPLPLSFAQQRLWFQDQWMPGSTVYNLSAPMRFGDHLDVALLDKALKQVIKRHEILRTTFAAQDGRPMQVIAPVSTVTLPLVDLREIPKTEQEAEARRLTIEAEQQPFDLTTGPLVRYTLLQLDEDDHILLLVMHHITSDAWSVGIFVSEMIALYQAYTDGNSSPFPELALQYADFAVWQRQWLQGEVLATQLAHWQRQLAGAPTLLALPTDRLRPPTQTFPGNTRGFQIDRDLSRRVRILSWQTGATMFMTLEAAFAVLLSRHSGQQDIVIGTPIDNRSRHETEPLIGIFVNTLVLRNDLSGNPSFKELLARVRQMALGAYEHQDLPFEILVQELQPDRDPSHNPLFHVMFAFGSASPRRSEPTRLNPKPWRAGDELAMFDLSLGMEARDERLYGTLTYNTDLFDAATIARMAGHFQTLLAGIAADPDQRICDLPLLTEAERRQLLVEWNNIPTETPEDRCVHELLEAQAERTPDLVAVTVSDQHLTFGALSQRSSQLARHLQRWNVGPEVPVAVYTDSLLQMVIGILGILKAGGCYVPLSPASPKAHLASVIQDAQVMLILTHQRLAESLDEQGLHVLCLDTAWEAVAQENLESPASTVVTDNLACVVYVSQSPDSPKGILVEHRELCYLAQVSSSQPGDRVLPFGAEATFPLGVFASLARGATLCLESPQALVPGSDLARLLYDQAITTAILPPSLLASLVTKELPELRAVVAVGEVCPTNVLEHWSTERHLYNAYGLDEATIWATTDGCAGSSQRPIVGRPMGNTQVCLLDSHSQPVPIGVLGELHIGGENLARGYHNHPELTAARFVPHPFSDEPGARLFKSGTLARYQQDGTIEFVGHTAPLVRIHGRYIEPGQVKTALEQHPTVREAVVVAREDVSDISSSSLEVGDRLVAYVVLNQEEASVVNTLRAFLKERLPNYMVPSAFVVLDALPLTPSGRVDRRALPVSGETGAALDTLAQKPKGSIKSEISLQRDEILARQAGLSTLKQALLAQRLRGKSVRKE
jgi:amino acid adenylation domain-containing protein